MAGTVQDPDPEKLPARVTMGLLPYLSAHALDEDYAQAAARRPAGHSPGRRRVGRAGAVVIAVFAILAVTAAAQTSQDSVSLEKERRSLIDQVKQRQGVLADQRASIRRLTTETRNLESRLLRSTDQSNGLLEQVTRLGLLSGVAAATGPGVEVVVDDAPNAESDRNKVLDSDMQKLVNGLWQAGAEAMSINGERMTALSPIRHAGGSITVNFTSLTRPYTLKVIGDPKTLPSRFADSTSGQAWLDLEREVGLTFSMRTKTSLRLPGAEVPVLRFVKSADPDRDGPVGKGPL